MHRVMKIIGFIFISYLSAMISGTLLFELFTADEQTFNIGFILGFFIPIIALIADYIFNKGEKKR